MKQLRYALLMLALFVPAALSAQAGGSPGEGQMQKGPHMPSVDDQLADLSQKLDLTDAQKPQVKAILQDQQDQMKQAMGNSSREEARAKMREIHKASSAKIRALLTNDQKAKFAEMQSQRRQKQGEAPPPQQ